MYRALLSVGRRLCRDERGAVLPMFTVAVVSLLLVTAVGVDFGNALVLKQKLISAADAAALAVGAEPELSEEEADAKGEAFIRAHYPELDFGDLIDFDVVPTASQVDVTVTARIPTTFLKVARIDTIDVTVRSQVLRQQRDLEVVMVLDNTGSMAECAGTSHCSKTKIVALKDAANKLVDVLFGSDTVSEHVKIGLVPFSGAVNVGSDKLGSGWIDEAGVSHLQSEDVDLPSGKTLLDLFDDMTNVSWGGCVRARITPTEQDLDLTDTPPGTGDTLWVPYFAPDEPGDGGGPGEYSSSRNTDDDSYYNDYINEGPVSCNNCNYQEKLRRAQRNGSKYAGKSLSSGNLNHDPPLGPNFNCVPQSIQPLTNAKSTIASAIDGMQAAGSTVIPAGLSWGWKVISPGAPYSEGVDYTEQRVAKAIVLLTDGRNQVEGDIGHNNSFYSAYGYAAEGHLGSTSGSQTRQKLDEKTTALCNVIKADKDGILTDQDVYIYTIILDVDDSGTHTLLQNCATPPADCPGEACYFDSPDEAQLETAFESIALGLNKLRLAK
jgi:Flp pilus assembly protein TadG